MQEMIVQRPWKAANTHKGQREKASGWRKEKSLLRFPKEEEKFSFLKREALKGFPTPPLYEKDMRS